MMSKGKTPLIIQVGKYSVHTNQVVGRGAHGIVYIGFSNEKDKDVQVAVKAIPHGRLSRAHVLDLKNEIDLLKCLKNKHIVQYKDHEETRDHLYIMMEYMDGGSLAAIIKRHGRFSEAVVAQYTVQVLEGLKYLHKEGICPVPLVPCHSLAPGMYTHHDCPFRNEIFLFFLSHKGRPEVISGGIRLIDGG